MVDLEKFVSDDSEEEFPQRQQSGWKCSRACLMSIPLAGLLGAFGAFGQLRQFKLFEDMPKLYEDFFGPKGGDWRFRQPLMKNALCGLDLSQTIVHLGSLHLLTAVFLLLLFASCPVRLFLKQCRNQGISGDFYW